MMRRYVLRLATNVRLSAHHCVEVKHVSCTSKDATTVVGTMVSQMLNLYQPVLNEHVGTVQWRGSLQCAGGPFRSSSARLAPKKTVTSYRATTLSSFSSDGIVAVPSSASVAKKTEVSTLSEFVVELLHCAFTSVSLVTRPERLDAAWRSAVRDWVDGGCMHFYGVFGTVSHAINVDQLVPFIAALFRTMNTVVNATTFPTADVAYVLHHDTSSSSSADGRREERWTGVARRLLHALGFWSQGCLIPTSHRHHARLNVLENSAFFSIRLDDLVTKLQIDPMVCTKQANALLREVEGENYHARPVAESTVALEAAAADAYVNASVFYKTYEQRVKSSSAISPAPPSLAMLRAMSHKNPRVTALLLKNEEQMNGSIEVSPSGMHHAARFVIATVLSELQNVSFVEPFCRADFSIEHSAALAVACSDVNQRLSDSQAFELVQNLKLLEEKQHPKRCRAAAKGDEGSRGGGQHRYSLTPSAIHTGLYTWCLKIPRAHWDDTRAMLCSLLELLGTSAVHAKTCSIELSDVPRTDPLHQIKDWVRSHTVAAACDGSLHYTRQPTDPALTWKSPGRHLTNVVNTAKAYGSSLVILNDYWRERLGSTSTSFDVIVGAAERRKHGRKGHDISRIMLLRVKVISGAEPLFTAEKAFEEWLELAEMGCRDREAVIARAVLKLPDIRRRNKPCTPDQWAEVFPVAMRELSGATTTRSSHTTTTSSLPRRLMTREDLFVDLCNDVSVVLPVDRNVFYFLDRYANFNDRSAQALSAKAITDYFCNKNGNPAKGVLDVRTDAPTFATLKSKYGIKDDDQQQQQLATAVRNVLLASDVKSAEEAFQRLVTTQPNFPLGAVDELQREVSSKHAVQHNAERATPQVFIVTFQKHEQKKSIDGAAVVPPVAIRDKGSNTSASGAASPCNVRRHPGVLPFIDGSNQREAWYPTTWGDDTVFPVG